jgi:cytochrome c biogenesis protein CcmG/thiol:disulfide interchange protein DsbE
MRRFALPAGIVSIAIVFLIILATAISSQGSNNSIAYSVASHHYRRAPDYTRQMKVLTPATAKTASLGSYRGHYVLVNMFAGWCTDCQVEAAALGQAQRVLAAHGGTVIGVPYQDSANDALAFTHRYHTSYPVLQDAGGGLAQALNVSGIPDSYLVDPRGRIIALNTTVVTPAWIRQTMTPAITRGL